MTSILLIIALALPSTAHAGWFRKGKEKERKTYSEVEEKDARDERAAPDGATTEGDDGEEQEGAGTTSHGAVDLRDADPSMREEPKAVQAPEGSLWDFIENIEGVVPTDEAVPQSEELDEERQAEHTFLIEGVNGRPPEAFYADPLAATADDPLYLNLVNPNDYDIPVVINDDVIRWMRYFTGSGRKYYARWLERSTKYRPMMYEKLDKAGLPRDLVYLSMIESGYATHAYSRAAAVGLWQFIAPTATEWGMRVDWWVDERRDPEVSTDAAIAFLGYLNKKFGSWHLAWAAYNGGPGRVDRAVARHGTKDFWKLSKAGAFPDETDNYVPKLIAAAIIGHHPERYGFTGLQYQERLDYELVQVPPSVGVDVLARCAGVSVAQFQDMNPHLLRFTLPPEGKGLFVHVPKHGKDTFLAALDKVPPAERITFSRHKVRPGESLGSIAKRYGVSAADLQRVNKISNPNKILVGMELVIPGKGSAGAMVAANDGPRPEAKATASKTTASKASAEPATAKAMTSTAGAGASQPKATKITHVVRKGEALSAIAARYGVSTSDVMRWNGISNANKVNYGSKLVIYQKASAWSTHVVRKGETMSEVAARYGCSVADLKSWNNLKSSEIYVGQKIKVRR
jgi:membrane-bound lytic murein transglycosylase D